MINIRQATKEDIPGIAKVQVDTWHSTYTYLLPPDILRKQTYEGREKTWSAIFEKAPDTYTHLVAENEDGEIVGFIDGGKERTDKYGIQSEIYAFYIVKGYQRQGLGTRLLKELIVNLKKNGIHSLLVWVLRDNPSRKFYKDHGAELIDSHFIAGYETDEVAYAWKDLSIFS